MAINKNYKLPLLTIIPIFGASTLSYAITAADVPSTVEPERIQQEQQPFIPKKPIPEYEVEEKEEKKEPKKEDEREKIKFKLNNVIIEGANQISEDELKNIYLKKLGTNITLEELKNIAQSIENYYRSKGYFLARIIIPPQRIKKDGAVVKFRILEGQISKVNIIGEDPGKNAYLINKYMQPVEDAPAITDKVLEKALLLTNDIPGVTAQAIIAPSPTVVGAAEVNLKIEKVRPNGFLSFDNRGTKYIGNKQLRMGGSLYGLVAADTLYADYLTSAPDSTQMQSGTVLYKVLVGSKGTSLSFNARKTHTKPGLELETDLGLQGRSNRVEFSVNHPLMRSRFKNWYLDGGFYILDSRNDITLTDDVLYNDKVRAVYLGLRYLKYNPASTVTFNLKLTKGLDIGNATSVDDTLKSRNPGASGKFWKANLDASYLRNLGRDFSLLLSLTGQYTNNELLSSEEFGYGGEAYGSAYDASEVIGDRGIAGKVELRHTSYPKTPDINYIQFFAAYDRGTVWNLGSGTQEDRESAASLSFGARFGMLEKITGSIEVAKPIIKITNADNDKSLRYFAKFVAVF